MLVTHTERPRELRWYHAGPMLYGDWGTSRFYVLGLALYYSQQASFWYVAGVCALVAAVGWAYTIICRCYPDGGGVYSAARHTSRMLAVVGALLLFADYIVTASLSAMDGMHYLQIKEFVMHLGLTNNPDVADHYIKAAAILGILLVGVINYIGPKKAGTFALIVALATLALTIVLVLTVVSVSIPHEKVTAMVEGWRNIHAPTGSFGHMWSNLVKVVLALSGVEAIANMTGIMVPPVTKTSKKAIWPVLLEVVIFNLVLAVAMNALPKEYTSQQVTPEYAQAAGMTEGIGDRRISLSEKEDICRKWESSHPGWDAKDDKGKYVNEAAVGAHDILKLSDDQDSAKNRVLWLMARHFVGAWFAAICGVVFGLLLLSAVNTAVADMVSIQYVMARDKELPHGLMKLNLFGVPWRTLLTAVLLPIVVLLITGDVDLLGDLYAIGVVGAIAINLGSCCINKEMPLKTVERAGMGLLAAIMCAIEITLSVEKPLALLFAGCVLGGGLSARFVSQLIAKRRVAKAPATAAAPSQFQIESTATSAIAVPEEMPISTDVFDMSKPKILVATRGGKRLIQFATKYAKQFDGTLFVLFVRQINVYVSGPAAISLNDDEDAKAAFMAAAEECKKAKVPMVPIYVTSPDVPYSILDFAATYGVDAVLMGVSRQGALLRALKGDVLSAVADHLPEDIPLLIHA